MATLTNSDAHDRKDEQMADEKFIEDADKGPVTSGSSAGDAALTRGILLKLDFRYTNCPLSQVTSNIPIAGSSPS